MNDVTVTIVTKGNKLYDYYNEHMTYKKYTIFIKGNRLYEYHAETRSKYTIWTVTIRNWGYVGYLGSHCDVCNVKYEGPINETDITPELVEITNEYFERVSNRASE